MNSTADMTIIKGDWCDRSNEVDKAQYGPFLYINGNGSHWAGSEESDLVDLYARLDSTELDPRWEAYGNFITVNPCQGVRNPNYCAWGGEESEEPEWIDGPRLFAVEPVVYFNGNFFQWSHGFSIYTNVPDIIGTLTAKIRANQHTTAYEMAKKTMCERSLITPPRRGGIPQGDPACFTPCAEQQRRP